MHYLTTFLIKLGAALLLLIIFIILILSYAKKHKQLKKHRKNYFVIIIILLASLLYIDQAVNTMPSFDYFMHTMGPADGPQIPFANTVKFLKQADKFRFVQDIARNPNDLPLTNQQHYIIEAEEVINEIAPKVYVNSWTFNGKIPGPFMKAKVGDQVTVTLKNKTAGGAVAL